MWVLYCVFSLSPHKPMTQFFLSLSLSTMYVNVYMWNFNKRECLLTVHNPPSTLAFCLLFCVFFFLFVIVYVCYYCSLLCSLLQMGEWNHTLSFLLLFDLLPIPSFFCFSSFFLYFLYSYFTFFMFINFVSCQPLVSGNSFIALKKNEFLATF